MTKIFFLAGLPGSGKSYHARDLAVRNDAKNFDDIKANAILNCSNFPFARNFVELINCLRNGINCVVSDIDFCKKESRNEATQCIEELVEGVEIEWIYFENAPEKCRLNILRRSKVEGRQSSDPIRKLEEYSIIYEIPKDAIIIQVWSEH